MMSSYCLSTVAIFINQYLKNPRLASDYLFRFPWRSPKSIHFLRLPGGRVPTPEGVDGPTEFASVLQVASNFLSFEFRLVNCDCCDVCRHLFTVLVCSSPAPFFSILVLMAENINIQSGRAGTSFGH
jgi:hypothetical protein